MNLKLQLSQLVKFLRTIQTPHTLIRESNSYNLSSQLSARVSLKKEKRINISHRWEYSRNHRLLPNGYSQSEQANDWFIWRKFWSLSEEINGNPQYISSNYNAVGDRSKQMRGTGLLTFSSVLNCAPHIWVGKVCFHLFLWSFNKTAAGINSWNRYYS